jgi:hypothetical protein
MSVNPSEHNAAHDLKYPATQKVGQNYGTLTHNTAAFLYFKEIVVALNSIPPGVRHVDSSFEFAVRRLISAIIWFASLTIFVS